MLHGHFLKGGGVLYKVGKASRNISLVLATVMWKPLGQGAVAILALANLGVATLIGLALFVLFCPSWPRLVLPLMPLMLIRFFALTLLVDVSLVHVQSFAQAEEQTQDLLGFYFSLLHSPAELKLLPVWAFTLGLHVPWDQRVTLSRSWTLSRPPSKTRTVPSGAFSGKVVT